MKHSCPHKFKNIKKWKLDATAQSLTSRARYLKLVGLKNFLKAYATLNNH